MGWMDYQGSKTRCLTLRDFGCEEKGHARMSLRERCRKQVERVMRREDMLEGRNN